MEKNLLNLAKEVRLYGEKFKPREYQTDQGSKDRTYECVCVDCNDGPDNCDC